jgi:hypothetical protein
MIVKKKGPEGRWSASRAGISCMSREHVMYSFTDTRIMWSFAPA